MSKKPPPLKRYLYISQRKIGMYDCQLPHHWWQRLGNWLLEFFAYRIHDSIQPQGIPTKEKRVLLYTPLNVAYEN